MENILEKRKLNKMKMKISNFLSKLATACKNLIKKISINLITKMSILSDHENITLFGICFFANLNINTRFSLTIEFCIYEI